MEDVEEQDEKTDGKTDTSETASVSTDLNDKNEPSYQAITLAFAKNAMHFYYT
jgi:hypothetical protein